MSKRSVVLSFLAGLRKRIEESRLQTKLIVAFGIMLTFVLALNLFLMMRISHMIDSMNKTYESNVHIATMQSTLNSIQDNLYSYLNGDRDALKDYYADKNDLDSQISRLNDKASYNDNLLMEKNIRNMASTYLDYAEEAVLAYRGTDIEKYTYSYELANTIYGYLETNIYTLSNATFEENTSRFAALTKAQHYSQILNITLMILASLAELLVIVFVTSRLVAPLGRLAERADKIGQGQLDMPPLRVRSLDEVGQVTSAFNLMVIRLNENIRLQQQQLREENRLKEEQLQLQAYLKDSQLGALQAQINPHFLYNTLNAGSQLAMIEDAEKTSIFLEHVADYFRYNLHRAGNDVELAEELSQVDNYIFIMNTRFAGDILYEKQITSEIPPVRLPGMILQPIVENAIEHGLRGIEDRDKRLIISVRETEDKVIVSIIDNGEGFSQEKAAELLNNTDREIHTSEDHKHGIGMKNVISRLRLFYDMNDVMEIGTMQDGTGTEIQVLIPKRG